MNAIATIISNRFSPQRASISPLKGRRASLVTIHRLIFALLRSLNFDRSKALKTQADREKPLFLCAETSGRRENLLNRLTNEEITPVVSPSLQAAFAQPAPLMLLTGALSQGFSNEPRPLRWSQKRNSWESNHENIGQKGKLAILRRC
ncbi:hypothetical protein [Ignatzschineria indica]|uniref:hypothetical protein n=1 Tax=Ignatzschineria indica TaxID=472583 RepID=UPI003641EEE1